MNEVYIYRPQSVGSIFVSDKAKWQPNKVFVGKRQGEG